MGDQIILKSSRQTAARHAYLLAASRQYQSVFKGLLCGPRLLAERLKEGQRQPPEGPLDAVQVGVCPRPNLTLFQLLRLSPAQKQRLRCGACCMLTALIPEDAMVVLARAQLSSSGLGLQVHPLCCRSHAAPQGDSGRRADCNAHQITVTAPECTTEPAPY